MIRDYVNIIVYARNEDYTCHPQCEYDINQGDLTIYNSDGSYAIYNRNYWTKIEINPATGAYPLEDKQEKAVYLKEEEQESMRVKPQRSVNIV